jgi:hypothetical protein
VPLDSTRRRDLILAKVVVKIVETEVDISRRLTGVGQQLTAEGMMIPQDHKVEDIITAKRVLDITEREAAAQAVEVAARTREAVAQVIKEKETAREAILVATGEKTLDLHLKRVCFTSKNNRQDIPLNRKDNTLLNGIIKNLGIKIHTR